MAQSARIYRGTPKNLAVLASRLRSGELVAVPTETVYGLAADATNAAACRRIFDAKGRPATDPLIVHIASRRDLARVALANPAALKLARKFWPGPLTIVLPKTPVVPAVATSGLPSVAVRMPRHPLLRRLIRLAGTPLAAPSANRFGYVSPTTAEHVRADLGGSVLHILDGGPSQIGVESTIVDLRDPRRPAVLRPGAISRAEIARALGRRLVSARVDPARPIAPGHLARHYSPRTPVTLHPNLSRRMAADAPLEAWVFIGRPPWTRTGRQPQNVFWLDPRGDLSGAARQLFATLRRLDARGFGRIHVEIPSGPGLAEALVDRLTRAAAL
ncbi:MAG TPA: L-threonylcarbamoyladenylate synthase [Opitutaceae bacterium]|jgi:L-threonylcarbamoyladenylate synthase